MNSEIFQEHIRTKLIKTTFPDSIFYSVYYYVTI